MRMGPLRSVSSSSSLMEQSAARKIGGNGGGAIRVPRGRHPLRGPFGKMLDEQGKTNCVLRAYPNSIRSGCVVI